MKLRSTNSSRSGGLLPDLAVALLLLTVALLPLAYSFASQRRLLQAEMDRAAVVQLVDGELELLLAGPWKKLPEGSSPVTLRTNGMARVVSGDCVVSKRGRALKIEWTPAPHSGVGRVVREGAAR